MSNQSNKASKLDLLQQALSATAAKAAKPGEALPPVTPPPESKPVSPAARRPDRAGQVNLGAWMDASYKSSLRLIQARKGHKCELQGLITEALNDLFAKYDVPTVPPK